MSGGPELWGAEVRGDPELVAQAESGHRIRERLCEAFCEVEAEDVRVEVLDLEESGGSMRATARGTDGAGAEVSSSRVLERCRSCGTYAHGEDLAAEECGADWVAAVMSS